MIAICKKIGYATVEIACDALDRGRESGHYDDTCVVYVCIDCNCFHIGHRRER